LTRLQAKSAVCPEVAAAMAEGALARSPADLAAAITGVAGPSRDEDDNPVGLVCTAVACRGHPTATLEKRYGDIGREPVRETAIADSPRALRQAAEW
jgi:nicotinamide-nucleotide amidase